MANAPRQPDKARFLAQPVEPFRVEAGVPAEEILRRMESISFQGRSLAAAHRLWLRMLADDVLIFLGLAGALSAGGLRLVIADLIRRRAVDCVVSTGANLYHDLHETRGRRHFIGSPAADDGALQAAHIDRVYDTLVDEDEFIDNDEWIADFTRSLPAGPCTTRAFLHRLGERLWTETGRDGILTAAYRAGVPIFCPAVADSSIGMGISQARHGHPDAGRVGRIDVIGDIIESANLVLRRPRTASVVLGGGTPKNFINQASVQAEYYRPGIGGHRYALQIVTDTPHFGGASGSTLDEAQSWGKLAADAGRVTVRADATIALPVIATALVASARNALESRQAPVLDPGSRTLVVDGTPVSADRFDVRDAGPADGGAPIRK